MTLLESLIFPMRENTVRRSTGIHCVEIVNLNHYRYEDELERLRTLGDWGCLEVAWRWRMTLKSTLTLVFGSFARYTETFDMVCALP